MVVHFIIILNRTLYLLFITYDKYDNFKKIHGM